MASADTQRDRSDEERESPDGVAERIATRMDGPLTVLGVVFLLVVAVDVVTGETAQDPWFDAVATGIWIVFIGEFLLRMLVAPSKLLFLRRNWWQILFLVLPFMRFLRVTGRVARIRPARLTRVLVSAVRGARLATRRLSGRIAALSAVTAIVVLTSSLALYESGGFSSYAEALHDAAFATITGEPIRADTAVADVLELALAAYSVVVFAFLAGSFGAYLLERHREPEH